MEQQKNKSPKLAMIPFAIHDSEMARAERRAERLEYTIAALAGSLVGSNILWLMFWLLTK